MFYNPKNLEYAREQINAMRERARIDAMLREAQPAKEATPLRARVALILHRLFQRGARNLGATKLSADSTKGLLILPNLIVSDFDAQTPQQRSHKML